MSSAGTWMNSMPKKPVEMSPKDAAAIVRKFYNSLAGGKVIDALDLVALDASLRDEKGEESHGIRAIAQSLLPYRKPHGISLESIESTAPDVDVVFRKAKSRRLHCHFSVNGGRIRSVLFERR